MRKEQFREVVKEGYTFEGDSIILGVPILDGQHLTDYFIRLPLSTFNRHGLIAGATGTGKTKTLQILAEQLSAQGVPSLVMDIKGDLSGLAVKSDGHRKIDERHALIGLPFIADSSPVDFWSLSEEPGARLRATVFEFGPVLFSKILDLNDLQQGIVSVLFKYADDNALPLLDLDDFRQLLRYATNDGKEEIEEYYGRIASSSVGAIMRKLVELEQQGADVFFGEISLDIEDLMRQDETGKGVINILRLTDIQDRPKLFSTFMLQMFAEIYAQLPEAGDLDKPKFVLFIDEAHLVFEEATDALLDQIEVMVKLIRSKGVGIFFVTQNPQDLPDDVLGQLGLKIQHALRAFTAKDRKAIKLTAQNYPITEYYDVEQLITELGIGEALVTVLSEKGVPTPLVHGYLRAPQSRMGILTEKEINSLISKSWMAEKYSEEINRESAHEMLAARIKDARKKERQVEMRSERERGKTVSRRRTSVWDQAFRDVSRTISRELTRGLLDVLGVRRGRRRRYR